MDQKKKEFIKSLLQSFQRGLEQEKLDYLVVISEKEDSGEGITLASQSDNGHLTLARVLLMGIMENDVIRKVFLRVFNVLQDVYENYQGNN